jgi:hypothetical protein
MDTTRGDRYSQATSTATQAATSALHFSRLWLQQVCGCVLASSGILTASEVQCLHA